MKPFKLFLSGFGGVGKSHLIKTIYQSVSKVFQYHGGSPDKQRVLILAPNGVSSINVNGIAIHSAFSIPCRERFYPVDCNSINSLRNKFSEVHLIIIGKMSDTRGLAKCLTLKLEAKVMLTVNVDVQDSLINGQIGVAKHLEIIESKVSIIYIKFDDPDAGKKN